MGTSVSLQQDALKVEPGESVTTELRVRNTGDVVDQFSFQPLGDAAAWITVEPPVVRLFPQTDQLVTVTLAPPRDATAKPGVATWAVKAVPQEDPGGAAVAEGTVDVGRFHELGAELQPLTTRGRRRGRFEVAVDNKGNTEIPVRLAGTDAEQTLGFEFDPVQIDSQAGAAHFARITVRPPKRIWKGAAITHPFQVIVEPQVVGASPLPPPGQPGDAPVAVAAPPVAPVVLNGVYLQEPVFPKWIWKALLALLALLLALFIIWKTLLKPTVESAARAVAEEEVSEVAEEVSAVAEQADSAANQAAQASEQAAAAEEEAAAAADGGGGGGGGALSNVFNETSGPTNFRLAVSAAPGATAGAAGEAMADSETFALTDVILQNPSGDLGLLRIKIADEIILESALDNFRDLDFHFVSPYMVESGEAISIEVVCAAEQVVATSPCDDAVSFAGFTTTVTEAPAG